MSGFASSFRRWWRSLPTIYETVVPYSVECACGAAITGTRSATSQIRICPLCKQKVFILGRGPLPPTGAGPTRKAIRPRKLLYLLGALLLVASPFAVWGIIWVVAHEMARLRSDSGSGISEQQQALVEHQNRADKAWRDGDFAAAADEYASAIRIRKDLEGADGSSDFEVTLSLRQRYEQADLVAKRQRQPISDLLANDWKNVDDNDVQTLFAQRRGKSVAFDILITRTGPNRYDVEQHLGAPLPRLDLPPLSGLERLPLRQKQRLIFGAKLASPQPERSEERRVGKE